MPPALPPYSPLAVEWSLDPSWVFLNHGSFGATPRAVQAEQTRWREQLEAEPVGFFIERHPGVMDDARTSLGRLVGADPAGLALLPNATIAVATVLANQRLAAGDELLVGSHEYPACQNGFRAAANRADATVVYADIPFPCPGPDAVVHAFISKVTPRTRLALFSHVTSPTGLVYPVERLTRELHRLGVRVLIDGAHAPGMIHGLDLDTLRPDYYTANCHKWVCSPKGSAFLYVRADRRETFRPIVLSNNAENPRPARSQFVTEFEYIGTQDYTALYSIPAAIRCVGGLARGGWAEVTRRNHDLCVEARDMLCKAWGVEPPAPAEMIGSIATIMLPSHDAARQARLAQRPTRYHDALQDALLANWRVQVPIWGLPGKPERFLRISSQLYNSWEQYEYLAAAVRAELEAERE